MLSTDRIVRHCRECDAAIPQPPTGRPPEWCSRDCFRQSEVRRHRARRQRVAAELRELRALRDSLHNLVAA